MLAPEFVKNCPARREKKRQTPANWRPLTPSFPGFEAIVRLAREPSPHEPGRHHFHVEIIPIHNTRKNCRSFNEVNFLAETCFPAGLFNGFAFPPACFTERAAKILWVLPASRGHARHHSPKNPFSCRVFCASRFKFFAHWCNHKIMTRPCCARRQNPLWLRLRGPAFPAPE